MYCFPYPRASNVPPIRVPYIASGAYPFSGPITSNTLSEAALAVLYQHLRSRNIPPSSRDALAPLIQSLLFFGLASKALGRDVKHDEFIEKCAVGSSEASIDVRIPLRFWSELKTRWDHLHHTLSANAYEQKRKDVLRYFDMAQSTVVKLDYEGEEGGRELALVLLSVHMLLYLIANILGSTTSLKSSLQSRSTQVLLKRMVKNGWCRKRLNFVEVVPMFYPALYFMSSFRPPRALDEDHRACTATKCSINGGLLQPFHRTTDCRCHDVSVPLKKVTDIVAEGGIPLIRIKRPLSGGLELEVVKYERTSHFTAVSHVWADRQFGSARNGLPACQVEYLDSVLAALPRTIDHWRLRDWHQKMFSSSGSADGIEPPSHTYRLFWLDTFCIPQDAQHDDLKHKAIESMNLIYAAASHTLVFDAGLQKLDAGQRPSSLATGSRPTFYGPTEENLPDVLGHICASNWMGRAWTLQEGVLSGHLVFQLDGSFAYLRTLWTYLDSGASLWEQLRHFLRDNRTANPPLKRARKGSNPFRDCICTELLELTKESLHVEEHRDYARRPADRAARFVKSHSLLQSRSTTQPADLPLILIHMSGMNGNSVSKCKSTNERMKLLFYGLETLPAELLFSECAKIGGCTVDSWIPREVVPERFSGDHTLQLGPEGFTFSHSKDSRRLRFFLISSSTVWQGQMLLSLASNRRDTMTKYLVKALTSSAEQGHATSENGWCVLVEDESPNPRGARLVISRISENKVFLHFDCSLRLSSSDTDSTAITDQLLHNACVAQPADLGQEFIIEKSSTPQSLGLSRPQNPEQYSDRLVVISQALCWSISSLERYIIKRCLSDARASNIIFLIAYGLFSYKQRQWVDRALHAFVHHAWIQTFHPTWSPNGRWKWFWKLSNYEPPIPFSVMMKYYCKLAFNLSLFLGFYRGMIIVTLYWLPLYPKKELLHMILGGLVLKPLLKAVFWLVARL